MRKIFSRNSLPDSPGLSCGPGLTAIEFADECDIHRILDKYVRTGELPVASTPRFGDFTDGYDYQQNLNRMIQAQQDFDALPARIRDRFQNDPASLLAFLADEGNRKEAVDLGLIENLPVAESVTPEGGEA